jgi:hypothetical protein
VNAIGRVERRAGLHIANWQVQRSAPQWDVESKKTKIVIF